MDSTVDETAQEEVKEEEPSLAQEEIASDNKKDKKKKKEKKEKEPRQGFSFWFLMLCVLAVNLVWMSYLHFYREPQYIAQTKEYVELIELKDTQIKNIQIIYNNRVKEYDAKIEDINTKIDELRVLYEKALDYIDKYGYVLDKEE